MENQPFIAAPATSKPFSQDTDEEKFSRVCFRLTWAGNDNEPIYEKISPSQFDERWRALEKCPAI